MSLVSLCFNQENHCFPFFSFLLIFSSICLSGIGIKRHNCWCPVLTIVWIWGVQFTLLGFMFSTWVMTNWTAWSLYNSMRISSHHNVDMRFFSLRPWVFFLTIAEFPGSLPSVSITSPCVFISSVLSLQTLPALMSSTCGCSLPSPTPVPRFW